MEPVAQCPAITTERLRPFRQRLGKVIMTITDSGYVSMEMMSSLNNQSDSSEIAKELFHISHDGLQVDVYHSSEGMLAIDGCPMPCQPYKTYTYPHLPAKQWKKYQHAYKFVEVVKSKTAKVVLVTENARCSLMENSPHPDFEICFHDGLRIALNRTKVTITDKDGGSLTYDVESFHLRVSASTVELVDYAMQCQAQCLEIEKSVNELQARDPSHQFFPITVGSSTKPFQLPSQPVHTLLNSVPINVNCNQNSWEQRDAYFSQDNLQLPHIHDSQQGESDDLNTFQLHNEGIACSENMAQGIETVNRVGHICQPVGYSETLCSEDEVRNLLLSKSAQFKDFGGSSSCSSSVKSLSASTTPQKNCQKYGYVSQLNAHDQTQSLQIQNMAAHDGSRAPLSQSKHYKGVHNHGQDQHVNSECDLEMALVHHFPTACNIPDNCDNWHYSRASNPAQHGHPYGVNQCRVPLFTLSQKNTQVNCIINPTQDHYVDDATPTWQSPQYGYVTPTKSSCSHQPHPPKCRSVGSIRHQQCLTHDTHNLTIGALLDERQLSNVKRNLFSEQVLDEPMTLPVPVSGSDSLGQDVVAMRPNPSLELSDCSDNDDFAPVSETNTQVDQPSDLEDTSSRFAPSTADMNGDKVTTPAKLRSKELCGHITPSAVRHEQFVSTPKHSQIGAIPPSFSLEESLVQSEGADGFAEVSPSSSDQSAYKPLINIISSGTNQPGAPPSCSSTPGPVPQMSASPRKPVSARRVACLSPLKTPIRKHEGNNFHSDSAVDQTQMLASGHLPPTYSASPIKDLNNRSSSSGLGHSKSSAPFDASSHIAKSREALNQTKSESSSFRKTPMTSNIPMSPQKEFLMAPPFTGDRSGLDLNLPPHVRNSLDMSISSYYSDSPSSSPSSGCDPIRQVFVPYTGWASFYANGAVWILYNDGTQIGVKSTEAAMIYIDQDGSQTKYKNSDVVPEIVKQKLERLPKVIDTLMKGPPMMPATAPSL